MQSIFQRTFAGQTLGRWLSLLVVILVGRVIMDYRAAGRTNQAYLRTLLETKTIEQTASQLVSSWRDAETTEKRAQVDWQAMEQGLSQCMASEARRYLKSADPYLRQRANETTPEVLAKKFLAACGAVD